MQHLVTVDGFPSDCALIIEKRMPFDPDTLCPLNLGVKNRKNPLQTSGMAHQRGHDKGVGCKNILIAGHSVSTQRKIFIFFRHTRLYPYYRTVNPVWFIMNSCKHTFVYRTETRLSQHFVRIFVIFFDFSKIL